MNCDIPTPAAAVQPAEIVREYGPFGGDGRVHGVSHDGRRVWAALGTALVAFDPASGAPQHSLQRACDAGTAFDGSGADTCVGAGEPAQACTLALQDDAEDQTH